MSCGRVNRPGRAGVSFDGSGCMLSVVDRGVRSRLVAVEAGLASVRRGDAMTSTAAQENTSRCGAGCRRGSTISPTRPTTWSRRDSSTRKSSECRSPRPGSRRGTPLTAARARTYTVSTASATGALSAFFEYEGREPVIYADPQPSFHIALRVDADDPAGIKERLGRAGYENVRVTDHGYCVSLVRHRSERADARVHGRPRGHRLDRRPSGEIGPRRARPLALGGSPTEQHAPAALTPILARRTTAVSSRLCPW